MKSELLQARVGQILIPRTDAASGRSGRPHAGHSCGKRLRGEGAGSPSSGGWRIGALKAYSASVHLLHVTTPKCRALSQHLRHWYARGQAHGAGPPTPEEPMVAKSRPKPRSKSEPSPTEPEVQLVTTQFVAAFSQDWASTRSCRR